MTRRICIVTGSRAEYGLLRPLIQRVQDDPALTLQLVVTGMHLSPRFGHTIQQILDDGFVIDAQLDIELNDDSPHGIAHSMALGLTGLTDIYAQLQPDIVVLLGDRFEILSAAQAAMLHCLPIAHIHGGEASEGLIDEAIRHSITKMAHLHFTAAEVYRNRVIQLGEDPEHVHNVGALAADNISALPLLDKATLEEAIGFQLDEPLFLVTYHPVTLSEQETATGINALLEALSAFPEARVIFTQANADTGGSLVNERIDEFVSRHSDRCASFQALGAIRYLSAMRLATAVIGNSSSGIIEAPILKVPTINIGHRQRGRLRAASIIDCTDDAAAITRAIKQAQSPEFTAKIAHMESPYGSGHTAERICQYLRETELGGLIHKRFHAFNG